MVVDRTALALPFWAELSVTVLRGIQHCPDWGSPDFSHDLSWPHLAPRARAIMSWRSAGISFLKYSQLAAEHVREALKEPMKSKKISAEGLHVRVMKYEGGKRTSTVVVEDAATAAATAAAK
jgi:hypothetical protein